MYGNALTECRPDHKLCRVPQDLLRRTQIASAKRIVVVDDDDDTRGFVKAALRAAGYEVDGAADGAQALALLATREADLLLTDLFMPGLEGFETIGRCRTEFPKMPIMVMSAGRIPSMKHDLIATATLLGVAATLRKPFAAETLLETVALALKRPPAPSP